MDTKETKQERDERKARSRTIKKTIYLGLGVIAILGLVFGMMWWNQKLESSDIGVGPSNVEPTTAEDHVIGDIASAKATLVEYSDFQCPACAGYEPLVKEIIDTYEDQGLLFVYRHFPLSGHIHAITASKVSIAADKQGKFWPMHHLIFEGQTKWSKQNPEQARETFLGYAKSLNLDMAKFALDIDSEETADRVQRDLQSGNKAGVAGTPTFYLNGKEVSARTIGEFKALIEASLNTKEVVATSTVSVTKTLVK